MAAPANQVNSAAMNAALDEEMIANFNQEYSRMAEILGIFSPEVMQAGQALQQVKITGELNTTEYVEGDEVPLSLYKSEMVPVGIVDPKPYRKQTTAKAILKSGREVAILRTDTKMLNNVRGKILDDFFTFLANGTGTATGAGLQAAFAKVDAALGDVLETNGDQANAIVHFVNRQDAADYLGKAEITVQNTFGMTYLENFLGVTNVFLTNKVPAGTLYATPVENIHVYGIDFSSLSDAGLSYASDTLGLIGVAHTPAYDHVSADTNVLCGALFFPEIQNYIIKGEIAATA